MPYFYISNVSVITYLLVYIVHIKMVHSHVLMNCYSVSGLKLKYFVNKRISNP